MRASNILLCGALLGPDLAQGLRHPREHASLFAPAQPSEDIAGVNAISDSFASLPDGTVIRGTEKNGVTSYKGLRFARPPVGGLRWAPPRPWAYNTSEVVDATKFGSACVQGFMLERSQGSEDCLFLNVWTPASASASGAALPVAVFIHGGSYYTGAGSMYSGQSMLEFWQGQAIVVSLNYRLNVFGFAGSDEMRRQDEEAGSTGNYGLQDQRAALQWVQENIGAFGGDKERVMVFGESAGAGSVASHLTMKKSWGLYSAAAMESGAFADWITQPMHCAEEAYTSLLHEAECADLDCMLSMSTQDLFDASLAVEPPCPYVYPWVPTADGVEAETHPWISLADGIVADVPILLGTNSDEGAAFSPLSKDATLLDLHDYWRAAGFSDADIAQLDSLYIYQDYPQIDDWSQYWWAGQRSEGDLDFSCPSKYASQQLAALEGRRSDTYMYHFEHVRDKPSLVTHFSEVPFVFHWEYAGFNTEADKDTADVMTSYWGNFIADSNPASSRLGLTGLPTWPAFAVGAENTLLIPSKEGISVAEDGIKNEECSFLIGVLDADIRASFAL